MAHSGLRSKTFTVREKDKLYEISAKYKLLPYHKLIAKIRSVFPKEQIWAIKTSNSIPETIKRFVNKVVESYFGFILDCVIEGDVYRSKYLTINVSEVPVIGYIPQTNFHTNFKTFRVAITENITNTRYYIVMSKSNREKLRKNLESGEYYAKYEKIC